MSQKVHGTIVSRKTATASIDSTALPSFNGQRYVGLLFVKADGSLRKMICKKWRPKRTLDQSPKSNSNYRHRDLGLMKVLVQPAWVAVGLVGIVSQVVEGLGMVHVPGEEWLTISMVDIPVRLAVDQWWRTEGPP